MENDNTAGHADTNIQFENEFFIFGWQTGWWLFNLAATTLIPSFPPPTLGRSHVQLVIPSAGMHGLTIISIWSFDCPHLLRELTSIEFIPSKWSNEIWITWKCMLPYIRWQFPFGSHGPSFECDGFYWITIYMHSFRHLNNGSRCQIKNSLSFPSKKFISHTHAHTQQERTRVSTIPELISTARQMWNKTIAN